MGSAGWWQTVILTGCIFNFTTVFRARSWPSTVWSKKMVRSIFLLREWFGLGTGIWSWYRGRRQASAVLGFCGGADGCAIPRSFAGV